MVKMCWFHESSIDGISNGNNECLERVIEDISGRDHVVPSWLSKNQWGSSTQTSNCSFFLAKTSIYTYIFYPCPGCPGLPGY